MESKFLFCWTNHENLEFWNLFPNADSVADKIIEVVEAYNANMEPEDLKENGPFGAMDFVDNWLILCLKSDTEAFRVEIEDITCYCSNEWVAKNTSPVLT